MRAFLNLRHTLPQRRAIFRAGLHRLGYTVHDGITTDPKPGDVFVTWNRIRQADGVARLFESEGLPVIVAENAAWGNSFAGEHWYTLARSRHNTAGRFPVGDNSRWDSLGVELAPFRNAEDYPETVILPQRGIGSAPTAMPREWPTYAKGKYGGRVRQHPGKTESIPLEQDLAKCHRVITWGSGAAIKALMMGVSVTSEMQNWIGQQNNTESGRLEMLRRLAWCQWRMSEIESGEAFARLLKSCCG